MRGGRVEAPGPTLRGPRGLGSRRGRALPAWPSCWAGADAHGPAARSQGRRHGGCSGAVLDGRLSERTHPRGAAPRLPGDAVWGRVRRGGSLLGPFGSSRLKRSVYRFMFAETRFRGRVTPGLLPREGGRQSGGGRQRGFALSAVAFRADVSGNQRADGGERGRGLCAVREEDSQQDRVR